MWRRCSLSRHLWRKLLLPPSNSHSQVLHKTPNLSSHSSNFTQIDHNHSFLFLSRSSTTMIMSEFQTEPHDATSSSEGLDLESKTHDTTFSSVAKSEKLENVLSMLQSTNVHVDECLESRLDSMDLSVDEEFVIKVLTTPLVPGEHLVTFFKWVLSKDQFVVTNPVLDVFANAICNDPKRKNVYALWDLLKEIGEKEKGFLNVNILNQLISAFSNLGKGKAALEVFKKFEHFGCIPNQDSYYLTIVALCRRAFYDWAMLVCQKMLDSGMLPESDKVGEIISLFCKGRIEKEAHIIYLSAKDRGEYPPQKAVNFLISCLSKVDNTVHLAQEMLGDFSGDVRKHSINPFSWVVRGLCRKKDTEGAKKLLFEMIEKGPLPSNGVFNSVITSLSKAGDLDDAKEMLKVMESRGLKPDVYTYSVIMSGYAMGGTMDEACKVLAEAKRKHRMLCPVTFHTLIRGYCKLGEFDKALKLLSEMKDYGVDANVDEYNKLIQSLCLKALDWQTAEKLLEEMKQKGLHLPGITRGLIRAVKELEQEAVVSEA